MPSVTHTFEVAEPVHEPHAFLARVDVGVVVPGISAAAQLHEHSGNECSNHESDYYYPCNHRQTGWRVNNMAVLILLPAMYAFLQKQTRNF